MGVAGGMIHIYSCIIIGGADYERDKQECGEGRI